jgi:hypothetical protein
MTNAEAITAVRSGGRCETGTTIFGLKPELGISNCRHRWRTVACDSETDVIECDRCGRQVACRWTFDDDFA